MLDKIKAAVQSVKDILIYILTPLAFLAGVIYYLVTKNTGLKTQIETMKSQEEIKDEKRDVAEAKKEADSATSDYESVRDAYIREHGGKGD